MTTRSNDPRSDGDLLAAVAAGDREAFRVLYYRHAPWLTVRLAHRCADRELVDEVVQDTFIAVWRSADGWRGSGEVGAWMWGIGYRRLVDVLRRRRVSRTVFDARTSVGASAEEQVLLGVEYGDLGGALRRLSPELRAVFQATVLDGLTTREAAQLLGIPHGTVKTRMMRARMRLREELA